MIGIKGKFICIHMVEIYWRQRMSGKVGKTEEKSIRPNSLYSDNESPHWTSGFRSDRLSTQKSWISGPRRETAVPTSLAEFRQGAPVELSGRYSVTDQADSLIIAQPTMVKRRIINFQYQKYSKRMSHRDCRHFQCSTL